VVSWVCESDHRVVNSSDRAGPSAQDCCLATIRHSRCHARHSQLNVLSQLAITARRLRTHNRYQHEHEQMNHWSPVAQSATFWLRMLHSARCVVLSHRQKIRPQKFAFWSPQKHPCQQVSRAITIAADANTIHHEHRLTPFSRFYVQLSTRVRGRRWRRDHECLIIYPLPPCDIT
jgi:hypothetical protein